MSDALSFEKVYTFADLERWEELRPGLPPSLAVLGHPVVHSVSPHMHNAALAELAKAKPELADWKYFKFDIEPERLAEVLPKFHEKKFHGLNLTVPHKVQAVTLIKEVTEQGRRMGAVNTLEALRGGVWHGHNTDGYGLSQALHRDLAVEMQGASIVILGAGGAARGALHQCLDEGCKAIWIGNRDAGSRQIVLNEVRKQFKLVSRQDHPVGFSIAKPPFSEWPSDVVVINATILGLKPEDILPLDVSLLGSNARIFDMTFQRGGTTKFVSAARDRGLRAADGLSMLVWQGTRALRLWTGFNEQEEPHIAQIMMNAACQALGLPPRHVS